MAPLLLGAAVAQPRPDPEAVESYIASQPQPMRPILRAARELVREAAPDAVETLKWGFPTWVGKGNVVAVMAFSDHVNLQFYLGTSLSDPARRLEGTGKDLRHVKLRHSKDVKDPAVKALVRAAVRLDGGAST